MIGPQVGAQEHLRGTPLFLVLNRRERWTSLLERKRDRVRREMYNLPLDERWRLPGASEAREVLTYLHDHAPEVRMCYVLSESRALDGQFLVVWDALSALSRTLTTRCSRSCRVNWRSSRARGYGNAFFSTDVLNRTSWNSKLVVSPESGN